MFIIFWRGYGGVVAVVTLGLVLLTNVVVGDKAFTENNLYMVASLIVSAGIILALDSWLHKNRSGQKHDLFLIPMRAWGWLIILFALWGLVDQLF